MNFLKRTKTRILSGGGLLLALIYSSLIGVGFSNWIYGTIKSANDDISTNVGNFVNLSEYLTEPNVEYFTVCSSGLVVNETIVYTGTISINTSIILKNGLLNNFDSSLSDLSFDFLITNNGTFNYFSSSYMGGTINPIVRYAFFLDNASPQYNSATSTISGSSIKTELNLNDSQLQTYDSINLEVSYDFDFSSFKDDFQVSIYDKLGDNPLSFLINIEVK